ncbi:flagellar biosynthesis anti-sigma factor FlgM [Mesoterricola silvestris]|uniref:Negative regulator of flagellin synthesis n=1 Tax=Mesoterricola silvestris TaxID=2927979 RepID=A0AA48GZP9_9BACT|nr:flagellar biosynthesis anti-sigma factor FlgM [Mesoterricola silvestris]BDU73348.1 flagellar biosynthesis anti-sigma factor FlgM [Mesoterricola silvestris]
MRVSIKTGAPGASQKVGGGAQPASTGPVGAPVAADALSVSNGAHFISVARARLEAIPDVRQEKVEAIRARIDADAYNPDGDAVADGLVREHTPVRQEP